jgi:chemotaxis-related protein WspD
VFSNEGKRVLDRVAPVGYLKEWRKTLAAKKINNKVDNKSVLVFRVNDEWFALPSGCLHEITEKRTIHRIPRNNNSDICGVVNIGGEVRVCYSFESILGVNNPSTEIQENNVISTSRFIVVVLEGHYYVFCVEQIFGLSWYDKSEIYPVPTTLVHEGAKMLSGVINHDKNKVAVLDVEKFQHNLEAIRL